MVNLMKTLDKSINPTINPEITIHQLLFIQYYSKSLFIRYCLYELLFINTILHYSFTFNILYRLKTVTKYKENFYMVWITI